MGMIHMPINYGRSLVFLLMAVNDPCAVLHMAALAGQRVFSASATVRISKARKNDSDGCEYKDELFHE